MAETVLDIAHAAMEAAPDDVGARLQFYMTLTGSELYMLLEHEAGPDSVTPHLLTLDDQRFSVVFDSEERLARFAGRQVPYAALSGRVIAGMLAAEDLGMGLNPDVAPSSILLPPAVMTWLDETLANVPDEIEARPRDIRPPEGLPETLMTALDSRLASAEGLARMAYLTGVTYDNGARGHMLSIVGVRPGAEAVLTRTVSDVFALSGMDRATLDVAFFGEDDPVLTRLARVGLRFDLPQPEQAASLTGTAPGRDPARPPKLR